MKLVNILLKVYNYIPLFILNSVAFLFYMIPEKYRYGSVFWRQYSGLISQRNLTERQREMYEVNLLRKKLSDAYENIPFYNNSFNIVGVTPAEFNSVLDLSKFPVIDKDIVRSNCDKMIRRGLLKDELDYVTTSGTTGQALGVYQDKSILMREWAYVNYIWKRTGYSPDSSRLIMRGKVFREKKLKGQCWQWDALKRELSIDVFAMKNDNLELYCKKIEKYKPQYIHGYASAIIVLCHYIEKRNLNHKFLGVLAVSESVTTEQRGYIEKVLKARVFSFYGHTERLVMAAECENSTEYHIEPSYGFVELIDSKGNQIWEPGIRGEIVATGFLNTAMPLIRYKTGDIAEWSETAECACGRTHRRLKSIEGRWKDVLIGKSGTKFSLAAINMHTRVYDNVLKYQFCQEKMGETSLKIVPAQKYKNIDSEKIIEQIYEKTGNELNVKIDIVEDIPLGANGKFCMINQKLKIDKCWEEIF